MYKYKVFTYTYYIWTLLLYLNIQVKLNIMDLYKHVAGLHASIVNLSYIIIIVGYVFCTVMYYSYRIHSKFDASCNQHEIYSISLVYIYCSRVLCKGLA